MPRIVGILTFMSGKNSILGLSEPIKKAEFLDICILMSSAEHEKSFITSGPGIMAPSDTRSDIAEPLEPTIGLVDLPAPSSDVVCA